MAARVTGYSQRYSLRMDVQADDHIENNGTQVVNNTNGNLQTRLGMKFYQQGNHISDEGKDRTFQPFIEAN